MRCPDSGGVYRENPTNLENTFRHDTGVTIKKWFLGVTATIVVLTILAIIIYKSIW